MDRFADFCRSFEELSEQQPSISNRIEAGRKLLSELTARMDWYSSYLERMVLDRQFQESQKPTLWPNEVTLYRSPSGSFVVLSYIWDAYLTDTIHDHGSWGIVGTLYGTILERKYKRKDNGATMGYADLQETSFVSMSPGDTIYVLPLNEGIHRMENPADSPSISINVYGKTMRRGYTQFFYPEKKAVVRAYPPKAVREVLAVKVLGTTGEPWAGDILKRFLDQGPSEPVRKECELALHKLDERLSSC
jgi:predicted metal-dependent enzyme (double-stranded beta helix superfamily)